LGRDTASGWKKIAVMTFSERADHSHQKCKKDWKSVSFGSCRSAGVGCLWLYVSDISEGLALASVDAHDVKSIGCFFIQYAVRDAMRNER
jgi:hypothetical protein